ncbi:MAG: sterol desaturase family protein [Phycisphaerales bacterium JB064]
MLETHYPTLVAVVALALCWTLEAVLPAVPASGRRGIARVQHIMLGLLNALPAIVLAAMLGIADASASASGFGLLRVLELPLWAHAIIAFLLLDAIQYLCHVLMHKAPMLWRLHAVHHHAEELEATTAFRFHTFEVMIHGLLTLCAVLLLGVHVHDVAIYNAVLLPVSMFHHSNTRLHPKLEAVLRWITVTPRMHRVHHSRWQPETDSNYAAVLSIWDRLFGTLTPDRGPEAINVGLDGFSPSSTRTFKGLLQSPFGDERAELGKPKLPQDQARPAQPKPKSASARAKPAHRPATA